MTSHPVHALGTILSVWAHPDDETYLAGGLMAAARSHGQRVVCVSATAGERGTGDPETWPPDRLRRVRHHEAAAAMAVLGVREHQILGWPDGALAADDEGGIDTISRLIDDVRPDTIVTFGPTGATFHPDHIAIHRWTTAAWTRRGRRARLLYAASTAEHLRRFRQLYENGNVYMTDLRPVGVPAETLAVDLHLDGADLDRKLTALRAMATQTADLMASMSPSTFAAVVADETFVAAGNLAGRRGVIRPPTVEGTEPGVSIVSAQRR
jgi:LmbE family N-acetylglucosaminyl deacetylase